jgi:hypothetical protein
MKLFLAAIVLITGAFACTQTQNYKSERDEVMKFHDVVMEDHGIIVNNQMKLDSMLKNMAALKTRFPSADTVKEKVVIKANLERLTSAEELMNDWMHKFEPDVTGKSNEDAIKYFRAERIKIGRIDSLYKAEIQSSDAYLKQFKK